MQYIAKTVKYPAYARAKGASGTLLVQFVIKKNGKTSQFEVVLLYRKPKKKMDDGGVWNER